MFDDIFASIIFLSFYKAKEKSLAAVCLSNQKQIATAQFAYIAENNGFFTPPSLAGDYNHVSFDDLLASYLGVNLTIDQKKGVLNKDDDLSKQLQAFIVCPNDKIDILDKFSAFARRTYSLNSGLGSNGISEKYIRVSNPSETIMFVEQHHETNVLTRGNHSYAVSLDKWLLAQTLSPHGYLKFTWGMVDGSAKIMNPYDTGGRKTNWGMWEINTD